MADSGVRMDAILGGYAKPLRGNNVALAKHLSYLVGWARGSLLFAQGHGGQTFEQRLDISPAVIGERGGAGHHS